MAGEKAAVRIEHAHLTPVRHPIKSARLLYSAPSWVLAGPIYLIAIIVMTAMVYSFWATKDELVVAPLRLERESVTVQSVVSGMVSRINVREGDSVETLDSLMEVQKTRVTSQSEQETLSGNKRDLENELDDLVREYDHKSSQLRLQMDDIKKTGIILRNQLSTSGSSVRHLVSKLRQAEEALKEVAALYANHDVTKAEWLRAQGKVDDLKKNLSDTKIQYDSALAELKNLETQEAKLNNETAQNTERFNDRKDRIMERLKGVKKKMTEEKSLVPGVTHQGRQTLYDSTFSGLVTQVHVKPGQLVDPGSPLVTIVKESAALEGRALVQNKDIGRLKMAQPVQIKYFAYPFQEYGIPTGVISEIATKPGGVTGEESKYMVRVALHSETIAKRNERPKQLEIGLEGVAEVKTGQKRFIELLFSPISRFFTNPEE